jgi:hypothetical protein
LVWIVAVVHVLMACERTLVHVMPDTPTTLRMTQHRLASTSTSATMAQMVQFGAKVVPHVMISLVVSTAMYVQMGGKVERT